MTGPIERAYWLKQQAKAMVEEADELLAEHTEYGKVVEGDYILSVTETKRFDAGLAKKHLSAAKFKKILKSAPDSKMARAFLDEDDLEKTFKIGTTRSVKPVTDA